MTPDAPAPAPSQPAASGAGVAGATALRQPLHEVWETAALTVLRQLSGDASWTAEPESVANAPTAPVEIAAHWELSGTLHGMMQLRLHRAAARAWAQLGVPAAAAEATEEPASGPITEAELTTLTQALHRLAEAATAALSAGGWGPVQIALRHLGPLRRTIENGDSEFPLRFRHPGGLTLELDIGIDGPLREQFRQGPRFDHPPMSDGAGEERSGSRAGPRWDLLLDIELDVTLRFGGRQMLLHDVLDLAPGSVLELDRDIDDPVELLVGGKVIAWGEVVVVDGNYGLRISRLLRRRERMAAMNAGVAESTSAALAAGGQA